MENEENPEVVREAPRGDRNPRGSYGSLGAPGEVRTSSDPEGKRGQQRGGEVKNVEHQNGGWSRTNAEKEYASE